MGMFIIEQEVVIHLFQSLLDDPPEFLHPAAWPCPGRTALAGHLHMGFLTTLVSLAADPTPSVHQSGQATCWTGISSACCSSRNTMKSLARALLNLGHSYFSFHSLMMSQTSTEGGELSVTYPKTAKRFYRRDISFLPVLSGTWTNWP